VGRNAWIITVTLLVAGAAVGAALVRRSITGGAPAVTSRTDYGNRHPQVKTETATFAAGCFWKLEHAMRRADGVVSTSAGYTGGDAPAEASGGNSATAPGPTHAAVSTGRTYYAEAVRVEFDPSVVSFDALLDVFWKSHDPMQFVREPGEPPSPGRSVIYYHTDAQRAAAAESIRRLQSSGQFAGVSLPTETLPVQPFFPAEAEHQQYVDRNGGGASCRLR
jgi:methionine-S-sulfoxide reductase